MAETPHPTYPLMRPDQAERLASVREAFAQVAGNLPRLAARSEVAALAGRLTKVDTLMRLDCLRIGMLGSSGAGKSTTVSNLLGVSESEGPTPQGGGGAGTGVATRIRAIEPGEPVRMVLNYMTREQYASRLADLVSLVPGLDEVEPGALLGEARAALANGTGRPEEVRSLIRLLEAHDAHGRVLGTVDDSVPFQKRASVLLHGSPGTPVGPTPLLREVAIDFPTTRLDRRLELIDLPGLGVSNRADEKLTLSFLEELNGAFVFLRAKGVTDEQPLKLMQELQKSLPKLAPRVWVIVSGFDSLDGASMGETVGGRPVLSYLDEYLRNRGIAPDRAILTGNHLYQAWIHEVGTHPELADAPVRLTSEVIARGTQALNLAINLRRGPDNEPIVPPKFAPFKQWAHEYESSVLVDGGIGRLRETIKTQVFDAVQREVRAQADGELDALITGMSNEVASAKARSHMDPKDLIRASRWQSEFQGLGRAQLQRDRSYYQAEAESLQGEMYAYLDSVITTDLIIHDPDWPDRNMLDMQHRTHSRNLRDMGLDRGPGLVKVMFGRVDAKVNAAAIEKLETGPKGLRDPKAAWAERTEEDRASSTWFKPVFDTFQNELVFVADLGQAARYYPKEDYLGLMKHKVQAVVREFVRLTLDQIAGRLKALGDSLLMIGDGPEEGDAVADALYADLIARLSAATHGPNGVAR